MVYYLYIEDEQRCGTIMEFNSQSDAEEHMESLDSGLYHCRLIYGEEIAN